LSSFTKDLSITQLKDKQLWRVDKAFEYHVGKEDSHEIVYVPEGYVSDGASIPRWLWTVVGHPFGEYAQAAVLHDMLCEDEIYKRKKCDLVFLESLKVLKVNIIKRRLMYWGVRAGGFCKSIKNKLNPIKPPKNPAG